jgi:pimeloyl-ACP methyl ester carboxylesterase
VAKVLEADYEVIMPDARGHGRSSPGNGNYSTAARVADLASLVEALDLERPVIGGHSLGADTSLHFAAAFPGKVRGIFLEDPPIILPGDTFKAGGQTINPTDAGKLMANTMRIYKILPSFIGRRLAQKMSPGYPDDEINPWIDSKRRVSFDFLNALPKLGFHNINPINVFKEVNTPIALFIGDRENMAIVTREAAREIFHANEKVEVVHLAGASHDIRRTRFDGYMPALRSFLESVNQS